VTGVPWPRDSRSLRAFLSASGVKVGVVGALVVA
jgi:hypothetical protein